MELERESSRPVEGRLVREKMELKNFKRTRADFYNLVGRCEGEKLIRAYRGTSRDNARKSTSYRITEKGKKVCREEFLDRLEFLKLFGIVSDACLPTWE